MNAVMQATALSVGYRLGSRGRKVVQTDLKFALRRGELTALLGPNGAGKSTLLRTLSGMQPPLGGELLLEERSLARYSAREISRQIGLVLTDKTQAGGLRVRELVALGRHPHVGFFGRLHAEDERAVGQAMEEAGIGEKSDAYLAELSDGERQKVMIAKALAQECPMILLDEPTAYLDVTSRIEIMHLLRRLARRGKTILVSTHDIEQALGLADRLWLLSREQGLVSGVTEDLVLGGAMDRIFGRGGIRFDLRGGAFRLGAETLSAVTVEAPEGLLRWVAGALERAGLRPAEPGERSELYLCVKAPNRIHWRSGRAPEQRFDSFEAWIETFKKL